VRLDERVGGEADDTVVALEREVLGWLLGRMVEIWVCLL
jgi:hypothetical protein